MAASWKQLFNEKLPHIKVQVRTVNDYQLISLEGQLVYENLKFAKREIEQLIGRSKGYIIDKTKLQFIDIAGVGFLLSLAKQVKEHSEGLAIVLKNNKELMNLLMLPKVHHYIHIVPDQLQAIRLLAEEKPLYEIEHYETAERQGDRG